MTTPRPQPFWARRTTDAVVERAQNRGGGSHRRWLLAGLGAYLAVGVVLTLVPDNPFTFGGRDWPLDVPVNLLMFVPPVALALVVWRRLHPLGPVAVAAAASATIETLQALSPRDASFRDLALNVAGALAGAGLGVVARRGSWTRPVRRLDP